MAPYSRVAVRALPFQDFQAASHPAASTLIASAPSRRHTRRGIPRPQRVKLHPARIAAVGRKSQNAFQREHHPFLHAVARNSIQFRVPASRAMRAQQQPEGNTVRVEPRLAGRAAPGQQTDQAQRVVAQIAPARSSAVASFADGTNHGTSPRNSALWPRTPQGSKQKPGRKNRDAAAFLVCASRVE